MAGLDTMISLEMQGDPLEGVRPTVAVIIEDWRGELDIYTTIPMDKEGEWKREVRKIQTELGYEFTDECKAQHEWTAAEICSYCSAIDNLTPSQFGPSAVYVTRVHNAHENESHPNVCSDCASMYDATFTRDEDGNVVFC